MRYFALVLMLIAGCYSPHKSKPVDDKKPAETVLSAAAEKSLNDYGARLSAAFKTVANRVKSGEISDHKPLFDAISAQTLAARSESMAGYEDAFTRTIDPQKTFIASDVEKALNEIADGFGRGAK